MLDLGLLASRQQFRTVLDAVHVFGLRRLGAGRLDLRRDVGGVHQVGADGRVESRQGEFDAVAGADQVFLGLGELDFEVQDVGLHCTARFQTLIGDTQTFVQAS